MEKEDLKENYAIIRQPIFDKKKNVIAYSIDLNHFDSLENSNKTIFENAGIFDQILSEELSKLSNGKKVFINFDFDSIKKEIPLAFSNEEIGINIENTDNKDTELIKKVKKIKSNGFDIIIDGFNTTNISDTIVPLADIYTVDFRIDSIKNKRSIFKTKDIKKIKLLARNVETETDFNIALDKEFDYFQGNFFTHLDLIPANKIPSFKLNLLKLLEELNKEKLDYSEIEEILKRDVALTYKLFKFMNSASIGVKTTINSINHALTLLGDSEVKKWLSIMVMSSIGSDKPTELLKTSLSRAKFCELIAEELKNKKNKNDYFLTGMFSLMDTFVGRPLEEMMRDLPLKKEIKDALSDENNHLRRILDLVKDYENGRWLDVKKTLLKIEMFKSKLVEFYNKSIEWSNFLEQTN